MRFTTFVAFMLPLAALAASTSPQPDSADADMLKQLGEAQDRFTAAFIYTSTATNATIDQLSTSQNDLERAILDEVQAATEVFEIAVLATANIVSLNDQAALGFDQLNAAIGTTVAQSTLRRLNKTVKRESFCSKVDGNLDLNKLRSNLGRALDGIDRMVDAMNDIITIQGQSVRQLFEESHLPVPPQFLSSCGRV